MRFDVVAYLQSLASRIWNIENKVNELPLEALIGISEPTTAQELIQEALCQEKLREVEALRSEVNRVMEELFPPGNELGLKKVGDWWCIETSFAELKKNRDNFYGQSKDFPLW